MPKMNKCETCVVEKPNSRAAENRRQALKMTIDKEFEAFCYESESCTSVLIDISKCKGCYAKYPESPGGKNHLEAKAASTT